MTYTSSVPLDNTNVYCRALQKQSLSLNIANTLFVIHGSCQIPTLKQSYLNCSTGHFILFLLYVSCYLPCMFSHSFGDISRGTDVLLITFHSTKLFPRPQVPPKTGLFTLQFFPLQSLSLNSCPRFLISQFIKCFKDISLNNFLIAINLVVGNKEDIYHSHLRAKFMYI